MMIVYLFHTIFVHGLSYLYMWAMTYNNFIFPIDGIRESLRVTQYIINENSDISIRVDGVREKSENDPVY